MPLQRFLIDPDIPKAGIRSLRQRSDGARRNRRDPQGVRQPQDFQPRRLRYLHQLRAVSDVPRCDLLGAYPLYLLFRIRRADAARIGFDDDFIYRADQYSARSAADSRGPHCQRNVGSGVQRVGHEPGQAALLASLWSSSQAGFKRLRSRDTARIAARHCSSSAASRPSASARASPARSAPRRRRARASGSVLLAGIAAA